MYRIVEFEKPTKHKIGAHNRPLKVMCDYKTLLAAEKALLNIGAVAGVGGDIGYRLDDMQYRSQREFYNPTNGMIYVKTFERNDVGKLAYQSFSVGQYRNWLRQKANNPFSKVI